ncbi:MAG: hypothetical protein ACTSVB_06345 [Candidatus Heimdallarchaeaceae archaeon]
MITTNYTNTRNGSEVSGIKNDIELFLADLKEILEKEKVEYTRAIYEKMKKKAIQIIDESIKPLIPSFHAIVTFTTGVMIYELPKEEMQSIIEQITVYYDLNLASLCNEILFLEQLIGIKERLKRVEEKKIF